jgi:hypothetical protein
VLKRLKALELKRGMLSLRRAPFYHAGLLKEKVAGRFGLQLQLTRPLRKPEATQALHALLATVIDTSALLASQNLAIAAHGRCSEAP